MSTDSTTMKYENLDGKPTLNGDLGTLALLKAGPKREVGINNLAESELERVSLSIEPSIYFHIFIISRSRSSNLNIIVFIN